MSCEFQNKACSKLTSVLSYVSILYEIMSKQTSAVEFKTPVMLTFFKVNSFEKKSTSEECNQGLRTF